MSGHDSAATDEQRGPGTAGAEQAPLEYGQHVEDSSRNVGRVERAASVIAGSALAARGIRRGSIGGLATAAVGAGLVYRGITGRSRLYRLLEDETVAGHERPDSAGAVRGPAIERSVTVTGDRGDLESYWQDPDRLTRLVGDFADVSAATAGRSEDATRHRWRVDGPFGRRLEWETELVDASPGEYLRWETLDGAPIPYAATIQFEEATGDRGTTVTFRLDYDPPGGAFGDATMQRLGIVPATLAGEMLGRFKSLAETGEIPTIEKNPSARGTGDLL
ncbi:YgaP-like transmembrane domain [Natronolimnohabitans innermongolicus]|uniref:Cyclase n=1 Tax=Natronolimnohabitans innermongolicus JCM 12255 TaxID=1227499 RepID=L9WR16_9EURY|nr:YgaP-like transmembrane domain [Natronolimnohabitans innermongolicus]ELY51636.1 cyclase [Natronolimnohabitans innermongolicus JCM 12255]